LYSLDIKGGEVRIYTDYGRIMRPLFIVAPDQKLVIKKSHIYKIRQSRDNIGDSYGWADVLFEVCINVSIYRQYIYYVLVSIYTWIYMYMYLRLCVCVGNSYGWAYVSFEVYIYLSIYRHI
jgi:hypothetical protein